MDCPIPKISTVLQELEGFTYSTALDIKMSYYTIKLDPDSLKICTIIFPWEKYSYLPLPMGVACLSDVLQAKMSKLTEALEFILYTSMISCTSQRVAWMITS
jgi:hypothetical protein